MDVVEAIQMGSEPNKRLIPPIGIGLLLGDTKRVVPSRLLFLTRIPPGTGG